MTDVNVVPLLAATFFASASKCGSSRIVVRTHQSIMARHQYVYSTRYVTASDLPLSSTTTN